MAYRFPGHHYGSSSQHMFVPALSIPCKQTPSPSSKTKNTPYKHSSTSPLSNRAASAQYHSTSSSQSSLLSSTPHAPRQKKPLPLPGRHQQGEGATLPSTHDLIKQHTYLDEGLIKGLASPSQDDRRQKGERGEGGVTGAQRKQAWGEESVESPHQPRVMQPFRRAYNVRKAPEGVPLLDLSRLNEPDEKMKPIELLSCEDDGQNHETYRSEISWGVPPTHPTVLTSRKDVTVWDDLTVQDVTEEMGRQPHTAERRTEGREGEVVVSQTRLSDASHISFVEQKMLSHERGRPAGPSPLLEEQPAKRISERGVVGGRSPPEALRSHMTLGMGVTELALNKRVRFEARVLTQKEPWNGRDVHRELCGFFFLSDSSLTIYEFRQFGKKSSALPMIQRGVYCHMVGHRKGQPYQINYIRKGATLHFRASDHPGLPDTMTRRPLVSFRITHVPERAKRNLLCEGRNPMECRSIDAYLNQPLSPSEEKENNLLKTLQGMLRSRLRGRTSKVLVGVGRHLSQGGTAVIESAQLLQALRTFHISIAQEDFDQLWQLLCTRWCVRLEDGGGVYVEGCVGALVGEMSEERKALVRKVFQKLDSQKRGTIRLGEMHRFFSASRHPAVVAGRETAEEAWSELFRCLQTGEDGGTISYADFEHYYEGTSIETANDTEFYSLLKNCWTV